MSTFAELRQALGFGPRRLRLLLWLKDHPELESGHWIILGSCDTGSSVKIRLLEGGFGLEEVRCLEVVSS